MRRLWVGLLCLLALSTAQADPASFSWTAVTQNADDTPLTNPIDAYGLGCSDSAARVVIGDFDVSTGRLDPSVLAATVDLAIGTWYCAASAHNADGWSSASNVVSVTIPMVSIPPPPTTSDKPKAPVLTLNLNQ